MDSTQVKTTENSNNTTNGQCSNSNTNKECVNGQKKDDKDDDTNEQVTVDTTRTPAEIREMLGLNSEDVHDGFTSWLRKGASLFGAGCGGSKSQQIEGDNESFGFGDTESRENTMLRRLRRRFSERRLSRRSKGSGKKYQRSKSQDEQNRMSYSGRQNSYKEAVGGNGEIVATNNIATVSNNNNRSQRVQLDFENDVRSNTGFGSTEPLSSNPPQIQYGNTYRPPNSSTSPGDVTIALSREGSCSYPCQTNVQVFPSTRYRKKDQPIVDPDVYPFIYPKRGYLVNIVNDRFIRQTPREGAHWDLLKMKEIGRKFGFRLFNYNRDRNLTRNGIMSLLTELQNADHSNCDCLMFMISTHGLEMSNPALRGVLDHALVCSDDRMVFTSTILKMFNDRNCPTLRGKPKIFFIQACRGEDLDHGADVPVLCPKSGVDRTDITVHPEQKSRPRRMTKKESVDEYDIKPGSDSWARNPASQIYPGSNPHQPQPSSSSGQPYFFAPVDPKFPTEASIRNTYTVQRVPFTPSRGMTHRQRPYPIVDTPTLRCSNDMLIMYAIPPGMFAWRSQSDGSWMIDYLHQILMSHNMHTPKNFLTLLTKVSAVMSRRQTNTPSSPELHNKKAIPVIEHKLDKDIIFQPKAAGSDWVRKTHEMSL